MPWMALTGSLLLGPLCLPQGNDSCSGSFHFMCCLLCTVCSVTGAFCVITERGGRSGKKTEKPVLAFQKDRGEAIHRAAHWSSELLYVWRRAGEGEPISCTCQTSENPGRALLWSQWLWTGAVTYKIQGSRGYLCFRHWLLNYIWVLLCFKVGSLLFDSCVHWGPKQDL